ncbi:hypothetical protein [Silanimonas lenta]|jgi:hypothetical protein|uniref:hypothetical protein n=1 Tax=Silanimonas lenta TaxID=265429 RepID=UPI0004915C27|nr:hypothetical protein [Silanimonas lenta]
MRRTAYIWLLAALYMAATAHSSEGIDYWRLATALVLLIAGALTLKSFKRHAPRTEDPSDR